MKFLHISDEHWSTDHLEACLESSRQIEQRAKEEQPDLIGITGDLQHRLLELEGASAVNPMFRHIQTLADIAPLVIIYGNENHDPKGSLEPVRLLNTKYPIHLSDKPETIYLHYGLQDGTPLFTDTKNYEMGEKRVAIHCLPYPTKQYLLREYETGQQIDNLNEVSLQHLQNIFLGFAAANIEGTPSILMAHCNVGNAKLSNGQTIHTQDIVVPAHDLELTGADYIALGHIHLRQPVGTKGMFGGSTYHVNWGETERKYIGLVEVRPKQLPVIKDIELTATRPMVKHECTIIEGRVVPDKPELFKDWEGADIRVRVTISEEQRPTFNEQTIKDFYAGAYSYKIEVETVHTDRARSESIMQAETLVQQTTEWAEVVEKKEKVDTETVALLEELETQYLTRG